jgi:ABC-type uncharacterized transport system auxiliary subunit
LLKERGVLKSSAKYYVSTAIDGSDVEQTIAAWDSAIDQLAAER